MKTFPDIITSRSNPIVKWAASLSDKKGRDAARSFIAEGEKLTFEAIEASLPVTHIFISESKKEHLFARVCDMLGDEKFSETQICILSDSAFEKISTEKAPQGIISVIKYLDFFRKMDIIYNVDFFVKPNERAIILASMRDPGNLGSVIRSSVAFGVDRIILSSDSADIYNPKTVRSAMGSLFRVKADIVSDLSAFVDLARANGRRVFSAELTDEAKPLSEIGFSSSDMIIIGNEGHGIPKDVSSHADGSVYIPISKKTESLNASVAAAIFMWEQSK